MSTLAAGDATAASTSTASSALPWSSEDPFGSYQQMRAAHGPVHFEHEAGVWVVLGYHNARAVLRGDGWSSDPTAGAVGADLLRAVGVDADMIRRFLLFLDPPDHTRLRGAVRSAFTSRAVAGMRERVARITDAVLEPFGRGEPFDVMASVARPLPIAVIAEWLDLGTDGAGLLWDESPALVRMLDLAVGTDELAAAAGGFAALVAHLLPLVLERRDRPGDDLLSLLATNPAVRSDEAVVTALLIALAGHETTSNLIGNSLARLLATGRRRCGSHPEGSPAGRRGENRRENARPCPTGSPAEGVAGAVLEELLRLEGPVQAVFRTATAPHELGGAKIATGDRVILALAAANRDPSVYEDPAAFSPERFGPDRSEPAPLAFGLGRHHCLGAALARLETELVLDRLLARKPRLVDEPVWRAHSAIRGPAELRLAFSG